MGNYASKGESYTKPESNELFVEKTVFENSIKTTNNALETRYTKSETDNKFQIKGDYSTKLDFENAVQQIKSLASTDNIYSKSDADNKFLNKIDAANMFKDYALISFVNDKFANLNNEIKTNRLNIGDYYITNDNSQMCIGKNDGQTFCFDGKIIIKK